MPTRRAMTSALFCTLGLPFPVFAKPVIVEGRRFDDRIRLFGQELVLNGTGVRAVAWLKGYAAGLYLPAAARTAAAVLAMPGPKRLRLQMLQAAPAAEFTKALDKGVRRNARAAELAALQPRMREFARQIGAVGQVRTGDVVDLDFEPGRGLAFSVNGTLRGEPIAGDDFYSAVLRAFLGEKPYDKTLRAGLLGLRT